MHVDKKVGWALEAIGVVLLLATATFQSENILGCFWFFMHNSRSVQSDQKAYC